MTMLRIDLRRVESHRRQAFHLPPAKPLASKAQALKFVNERGFIFFWPINRVDLPSLWIAVAGDRPVADAHDDPGHVTWDWKDEALPRRIWYYAKVLRRKATIISLDIAPFFYALSANFGSIEEDHLVAYHDGRLTLAAKNIYERASRLHIPAPICSHGWSQGIRVEPGSGRSPDGPQDPACGRG
jgi:hypothetical protein